MLSNICFIVSIILILGSILCVFEPMEILSKVKYIFLNYFPIIIYSIGAVLFLVGLWLALIGK